MVGIFLEIKRRPTSLSGRQKNRSGRVHLPHAPDAESGQYRNDFYRCKNILARIPVFSKVSKHGSHPFIALAILPNSSHRAYSWATRSRALRSSASNLEYSTPRSA